MKREKGLCFLVIWAINATIQVYLVAEISGGARFPVDLTSITAAGRRRLPIECYTQLLVMTQSKYRVGLRIIISRKGVARWFDHYW
jgi:hypothetical protein